MDMQETLIGASNGNPVEESLGSDLQVNCFLPHDILIEIMLLLPFESIQACKLVSRQWKNLTDDRRLVNHTSLAFFYLKNTVYCVLGKESKKETAINPPLAVNRIPIELENDDGIRELHSESSKGIACVVTELRRLLFYNLFTGDITITTADIPSASPWICCGFGYNRSADDCKMIRVFREDDRSLFHVYSLRDGAWKSFKGFPYAAYIWQYRIQSCSVNGVLHWALTSSGTLREVIVTCDLHTCRFGELLLPSFDIRYCSKSEVVDLGGRICYWTRPTDNSLRAWVMSEYGVRGSWTMFLSIDLTRITRSPFRNDIQPMM